MQNPQCLLCLVWIWICFIAIDWSLMTNLIDLKDLSSECVFIEVFVLASSIITSSSVPRSLLTVKQIQANNKFPFRKIQYVLCDSRWFVQEINKDTAVLLLKIYFLPAYTHLFREYKNASHTIYLQRSVGGAHFSTRGLPKSQSHNTGTSLHLQLVYRKIVSQDHPGHYHVVKKMN